MGCDSSAVRRHYHCVDQAEESVHVDRIGRGSFGAVDPNRPARLTEGWQQWVEILTEVVIWVIPHR